MFPDLPFGNPDSEKVEARKSQLDTFLKVGPMVKTSTSIVKHLCNLSFFFKQLSSIPETANSEDMQEFLALNSDGGTYFGRKPFAKSRIDKVRTNIQYNADLKMIQGHFFEQIRERQRQDLTN